MPLIQSILTMTTRKDGDKQKLMLSIIFALVLGGSGGAYIGKQWEGLEPVARKPSVVVPVQDDAAIRLEQRLTRIETQLEAISEQLRSRKAERK